MASSLTTCRAFAGRRILIDATVKRVAKSLSSYTGVLPFARRRDRIHDIAITVFCGTCRGAYLARIKRLPTGNHPIGKWRLAYSNIHGMFPSEPRLFFRDTRPAVFLWRLSAAESSALGVPFLASRRPSYGVHKIARVPLITCIRVSIMRPEIDLGSLLLIFMTAKSPHIFFS